LLTIIFATTTNKLGQKKASGFDKTPCTAMKNKNFGKVIFFTINVENSY